MIGFLKKFYPRQLSFIELEMIMPVNLSLGGLHFNEVDEQPRPEKTSNYEIHLFQATERLKTSEIFSNYSWEHLMLLIHITQSVNLIRNASPEVESRQYKGLYPRKAYFKSQSRIIDLDRLRFAAKFIRDSRTKALEKLKEEK
jgi:hypothetical protein